MIELEFPLSDFVQVTALEPRDSDWPVASPFNLRFTSRQLSAAQAAAISGSGLYMISNGLEVVYVGIYRPALGNIIADRWGRHLQTITGRGYNIGLGGRNPDARKKELLNAVDADDLRSAIEFAHTYSQKDRFRDTGYNTTPNRLRFASENWNLFGTADGSDILQSLTFWLLRIRGTNVPGQAASEVQAIEKRILRSFKPVCNKEFKNDIHAELRIRNTIPAITDAIRDAANEITGQDISHRIQLTGVSA